MLSQAYACASSWGMTLPFGIHEAKDSLRFNISLLGGQMEPTRRFNNVFRGQQLALHASDTNMNDTLDMLDIPDIKVQEAKGSLRFGESLISGHAIPMHGLNIVLRYATPLGIHEAEGKLRFDESLVGGGTEPTRRLKIVLRYALAFGIHDTDIMLC